MIYLFHGENQPALRDALIALKKEYDEAIFWAPPSRKASSFAKASEDRSEEQPSAMSFEGLETYLRSPSLFAKKELVIVELLKGGIPKGFWDAVGGGGKDVALVFSDKIPAKQIPKNKDLPAELSSADAGRQGLQVRYFREEIPKSVFPLLDAIAAKNKKLAFSHAQRLLKAGEDPQYLLAMIVWQMRNLAKVKGGAVKGLHPYVLGKLQRAAGRFSEEELARVFGLLLKEDLGSKKGKANSATLEFLINQLTANG